MRLEERIEPFLDAIAKYWHKVNDLRFAQLIHNVEMYSIKKYGHDLFYTEEEDFVKLLKEYVEHESKRDN